MLLGVAGFSGLWSALSLQVQDALIGGYVLFFGVLMCAFAIGAGHEGLRLWFGFLHTLVTQHAQNVFARTAAELATNGSRRPGRVDSCGGRE